MSVVLVTGGIGSGKSEVCRILQDDYGIPCYNADSKVKELYVAHPHLLTDIEETLGVSLRDSEGNFSPALLAERIFSSETELEKVEALVFPALADDFEMWKSRQRSGNVIIESATALEKDSLSYLYEKVVVVDAPFEVRLSRACARDASAKDAVMRRMNVQVLMNRISEGFVDNRVDYLLENDSDLGDLKKKVADMVSKIFANK